jgi:putative DNA primase/helicase
MGYVFIKNTVLKLEKGLILFGTGKNGKSVFFEVINALIGQKNISNYSLQSLTDNNGYTRSMLPGKLLNYATEISEKMNTTVFKALISGETVEARMIYKETFTLTDYCRFIFNSNSLPKDVEQNFGFFRRFLIIPFDVTIPPQEQDKSLHAKIIEKELSGVFNWVLQGLNRLLEQKRFSNCEAAQIAVEQYRTESDSVQMFLNEHEYSISITNEIALKDMYSQYRAYCIESGFKLCSLKSFAERLRNSGYTTDRKNIGTVVFAEKKIVF